MSESEEEIPEPRAAIRPRLISHKKKTVFVFQKEEDTGENEEEDPFYDFTEIERKFRIIDDMDD